MQFFTNQLAANVPITDSTNYFDGPSVNQGNVGTWFASGTISFYDTTVSNCLFQFRLWDGVTIIASTQCSFNTLALPVGISLSGIITNPAGNIRISARNGSSTSSFILSAGAGAGNTAATLSAMRIA